MHDDTQIGGKSARFPDTRQSVVAATCGNQPEKRRQAFETVVAAYWKPVYKFIRLRWGLSNEDAKDLTQQFFAKALEKQFFRAYCVERASFRTFLRTCVMHFVINESKYAHRLKRGGDATMVEFGAQQEPAGENIEDLFEKEWIRTLFTLAVDDLRQVCVERNKSIHFELFERYDLDRVDLSYRDLAEYYAIAETDVTNY